jgi:hypothetical protein
VALYNDAILVVATDPIQRESSLGIVRYQCIQLEQAVVGITQCLMEVIKANLINSMPVTVLVSKHSMW